jgi:hypothetical protein
MNALSSVVYFLSSSSISIVALNSPYSHSHRLILLIPLTSFALLAFWHIRDVSPSVTVNNILGLFVLIWFAHISDVLLVEKHVMSRLDGGSWDWKASYKIWINARRIGTKRQVPNIRSRTGASRTYLRNEKKIRISSTRSFLSRRLISLTTIGIACYLHGRLFVLHQPINVSDLAPPKHQFLRRLSQITTREIVVRACLLIQWVWLEWTVLTGLHDALAILFVSLQFDPCEDWPPLFGNLAEAYTIRRFWSKFWHRIVYRPYMDFASALLRDVFGISRASAAYRLLVTFLVFLFSGIVHALVSWRLGYRCGVWEEVAWFCMNFVAILFEDAVQQGFVIVSRRYQWDKSYHTFWKPLGFIWVFGFFFWSYPKVYYPKMYCGTH